MDSTNMNCDRIRAEDVIERYLLGRLPEDERDAFEAHYFECARCFEEVQTAEGVRDRLSREREPATLEASRLVSARVASAFRPSAGVASAFRRKDPAAGGLFWLAQAAAVILMVAGAYWLAQQRPGAPVPPQDTRLAAPPAQAPVPAAPSERVTRIAELARVEPPEYLPLTMRSAGSAVAQFDAAMAHYARGDFAAAAAGLDAAAQRTPRASRVQFHRGIANLMIEQPPRAVEAFDLAVRGDDEAYADPSRFFRAKGHLRMGNVEAATRDLAAVARGTSQHADEAKRLLDALKLAPAVR